MPGDPNLAPDSHDDQCESTYIAGVKTWTPCGCSIRSDPRADPNFVPSTYRYRDEKLNILETTQVPYDDEKALAMFHEIKRYGPGFAGVTYIEKAPPAEHNVFKMMPYKFENDTVTHLEE